MRRSKTASGLPAMAAAMLLALMAGGCSKIDEDGFDAGHEEAETVKAEAVFMLWTGGPDGDGLGGSGVGGSGVGGDSQQATRSEAPPSEEKISDVNAFLFNDAGLLEEALYLQGESLETSAEGTAFKTTLVKGMTYSVYVCANISYKPQLRTIEDVLGFRYWMSRPDDYHSGIPMSGHVDKFTAGEVPVRIPMTRAMTKVTIDVDRSLLDSDVSYHVSSVRVGNCPKSVLMFGKGSVKDEDDVFAAGFSTSSLPATVYLLENIDPAREDLASYMEVMAEYDSDSLYTKDGQHLTYRFFIEDSPGHSVGRNMAYGITVTPRGKGLGGDDWTDDWRIDKGELSIHYKGEPWLKQYPSSYIECRIGDVIHLGCEIYPPDTPFDIGMEYLEEDHANGLYDFEVDESGTGVWLTMKEGGMGWIYMEAGEPIDDAALFVIMCEP